MQIIYRYRTDPRHSHRPSHFGEICLAHTTESTLLRLCKRDYLLRWSHGRELRFTCANGSFSLRLCIMKRFAPFVFKVRTTLILIHVSDSRHAREKLKHRRFIYYLFLSHPLPWTTLDAWPRLLLDIPVQDHGNFVYWTFIQDSIPSKNWNSGFYRNS